MESMRIITRLAVLAVIGGVVSCGGTVSEPFHNPEFESSPVKLLSAKRNTAGGYGRGVPEPGGGESTMWDIWSSWMANPVALGKLESALINRPWVSIPRYRLNGDKRTGGHFSQERSWIDCSFSNGLALRVFFSGLAAPVIFDGWHDGNGRFGYQLDISVAECQEILELSGWDKLEHFVSEVGLENDPVLGLMVKHPGTVFRSSLAHDPEVEPASVLVATRSTLTARGDTLRLLEKAVQGLRRSTLRFTMDGEVHTVERSEKPEERIVCQMSDGQTIEIHVFASGRAWRVIGEGSFRLDLSESDASELLNPSGWKL